MSDLYFPEFALTQVSRPRPFFDTAVQGAPSGPEARVGRRSVARYRIPIHLQLRTWLNEDRDLFGFFEYHGGMRDSFLFRYTDPRTNVSTDYRCRFDVDSLDDLEYETGGLYSGTLDLVTVIA